MQPGASPRVPAPAPQRASEPGFALPPPRALCGAPPRAPFKRVPSSLSLALAAAKSFGNLASADFGSPAPVSPLAVPPPGLPRLRLGRSASCSALGGAGGGGLQHMPGAC